MEKEKVIIRKEYDPYMKIWKYLCIFPEAYEGNGRFGCVAIWKANDGHWWHEGYDAGEVGYFYKCKIVHKNTPEAAEALSGLVAIYGDGFRVVEKMTNRL